MATIAVAGFHHETNTFAPSKATYTDFESGGGWPPLTRGGRAVDVVDGMNIAMAGFASAARAAGHRLVPLIWANATPSAHVTRDAYERIAAALLEELGRAEKIDAIYLDLHGAMVTEHLDDGEGDLLRRVRGLVGERVPIVVSLDYHANITEAMVEHADALVGYRTYPHIDMAETGARAATLLDRTLDTGTAPAKGFIKLDFLIPLTAQCTMIEPSIRLFGRLAGLETQSNAVLTFSGGFPAADIAECGPSVVGYGFDRRLGRAVNELARDVADAEGEFQAVFLSPQEGVARAIAHSRPGGRPVVLADTQDNPGAGGNGDTVGILEELLRQRAQEAVVGLLIDPASAERAHAAGAGAELEFSLGAISGLKGHTPCRGRFKVERLGDGNFVGSGPFYRGSKMRLGPMAALRRDGVTVVLASKKVQAADQAMFRCLGIEPARQSILALKSSVHFRADFQPVAAEVLVVAAPGPMAADPASLPWSKLRHGVRLHPMGPAFAGAA